MSITIIGDNPENPGGSAYTYIPDQLIAGCKNLVTQAVLLGAGKLPRGAVLGQQTAYALEWVASAQNTGNGTLTALSPGPDVEYSVPDLPAYLVTATSPTEFSVTDPQGDAIGTATVGTPFTSNEVNFTVTAGATAFVAGDDFTLTAIEAIGTYVSCVRTATDGSQVPTAVLLDFADATGAPVPAAAYVAGELNGRSLVFDPSWSLLMISAALRPSGIFVKQTSPGLGWGDPSTP